MINEIAANISSFMWGPILIGLLVGTGVYFTVRLRFIQVRRFLQGVRITLGLLDDPSHKGQISHFQALCTSLSGTIGTGNIAGVATAVALGGPGAIFWLWITGLLGMVVKYAECGLAIKYRVFAKDDSVAGGPMYYIERGLKMRWLGVIFAVLASITAFFIGNMVQSNSVADVMHSSLGVPKILTGLFMAVFIWLVLIGGIRRIARVAEGIVPLMCIVYIAGAVLVLALNLERIWPAILLIFRSAFTPSSAMGGFAGSTVLYTMRMGIARGIFSNEAGLGSSPIAHAAAKEDEPARQGLVAMMDPFIDTIVVCTLTGLVIVVSGLWASGLNGATLTAACFRASLDKYGDAIVVFGLLLFALSTLVSWSYYGDRSVFYLFGQRATVPYKWLYCLLVPIGAVVKLDLIWNLADIANALMAIPNLIALIALSGVIIRFTRDYEK